MAEDKDLALEKELTIVDPPPPKSRTRAKVLASTGANKLVAAIKAAKERPSGPGIDRPHTMDSLGVKKPRTDLSLLRVELLDKVNFTNTVYMFPFVNSVAVVRMDKSDGRFNQLKTAYRFRVETVDEVMERLKANVVAALAEINSGLEDLPEEVFDADAMVVRHEWFKPDGTWRDAVRAEMLKPEPEEPEPEE